MLGIIEARGEVRSNGDYYNSRHFSNCGLSVGLRMEHRAPWVLGAYLSTGQMKAG